jgi:methylglutaconyl-CoA hydratase
MTSNLVLRQVRGPVAVLTMNRPDQRNALSRALVAQLLDAVDELSVAVAVRAVVLTGSGQAFCAGMDLKEAAAIDATPEAEHKTVATLLEFADLLQRVHTMPKPVVAAVNGDALAGGAGLMTACDLVVAATTARVGYPEVHRGMVASIVMHDLVRQIGDRRARELLLGGELISTTVAQSWGLVNSLATADNCLDEAIRLAEQLSEGAPMAQATVKRLLDEATSRPRDLRGAAAISAAVRCSEEAHEGIRAFIEKRPPSWAPSKPEEKTG